MKAECKDCVLSQPNEKCSDKKPDDWKWSEDYECAMGEESFPDCAHSCIEFTFTHHKWPIAI